MRRLLTALCVALIAPLVAVAPASAASSSPNRQVRGSFIGTSVFNATPSCSFFDQVYDGSFSATSPRDATQRDQARRKGAFHLDGCVTFGPGAAFTYTGAFTLTAPDSGRLAGTVNGVIGATTATGCAGAMPVSLDFTLTATHGTKQLEHTVGSVHLTGTWCSPAVPGVAGPISGTFTGSLSKHH